MNDSLLVLGSEAARGTFLRTEGCSTANTTGWYAGSYIINAELGSVWIKKNGEGRRKNDRDSRPMS